MAFVELHFKKKKTTNDMKTLPTLSVLYYLIELNVFLLPIFTEHASASISFVG